MVKNILKFMKSNISLKKYEEYKILKGSDLFDEEFYLETYPDIRSSKLNPQMHYLFMGYKEGRIPGPDFNPNFYYSFYPDIHSAGINPLVHYIEYGKDESRIIQKAEPFRIKEEISDTNRVFLNFYEFDYEPLVSIIILNYNGINHLKRLFKDFDYLANYSNYEIIVVDNNSSDESVDYLNSLKEDLPLKIIKNSENLSFSKANNEAAKIANGEYLLLLNNDIEPTFSWLNEMMGTILFNENVGVVGAKLVFPYYFIGDKCKFSFQIQHCGDYFGERLYPSPFYTKNRTNEGLNIFNKSFNCIYDCISVTGAAMLIEKSIFDSYGGLDEGFNYGLEDFDFCLKLYKDNIRILYCGSALLFHHESSTRILDKDYVNKDIHNVSLFNSKWQNYLSKLLLVDKIKANNFLSSKNLKISIADNNFNKNKEFISSLAIIFNELGYELDLLTDFNDNYLGESTDILISFSKDLDLDNLISREDLFKIFVIKGSNNSLNVENYDLVISTENNSEFDYISSDNPKEFVEELFNKILLMQ